MSDLRLQAIDLRQPIQLAVEHIYKGAVDRRQGCKPFETFDLTATPPRAEHAGWGSLHMAGRFLDALAVSAPIVDVPADDEVIGGLQNLLFASLDNPTGFAFNTDLDPKRGRVAGMHNCREVLIGLIALATWRSNERARELARRFVRTIEAATRETGNFIAPTMLANGWDPDPGEFQSPHMTSGRLIGALLKYYHATEDAVAIDVAMRLADHNIAKTFTAAGELTDAAGSHLHSTEGTVTGIIELGRLTNDAEYVEIGKQVYDVGLKPWRTSFGWAKESRDATRGRGEANNTGDLIQSALLLGQLGWRKYFSDAERFIRNGLLASQIVNTDWIPPGDGRPDTDAYVYSDMRKRARGAFVFTTPNNYHSYNTDLVGGSVQSLCDAWNAILAEDQRGWHVKMFFSRESETVSIRSHLPEEGRLQLTAHRGGQLFVRLPPWLDRQSLAVLVDGQARPIEMSRDEFQLPNLKAGSQVEMTFSQARQQTTEKVTGYDEELQVDWLGDTVKSINVHEQTVPLY